MSALRRASLQLLSQRSVHLRIQPRPANLSESREILRVLQRFGEISTYKYLRYEYHNPADNIALAIYREAESAQRALNASPIRFALEQVVNDDAARAEDAQLSEAATDEATDETTPDPSLSAHDGFEEMIRPSSLLHAPLDPEVPHSSTMPEDSPPPMPFEEPLHPKQTTSKWFQVTVDRSRVIHQDYVERQPYWKQFTPMKSIAQEDLAKSVPHIGLSDVSKRPPHAHRTPNHIMKLMANYVEKGMPSLKKMYEESGNGGQELR